MRRITNELVDAFPNGQVEIMDAFADPYPAHVLCELLGVPAGLRESVRGWANDLGLGFGYTAADNQERIETALSGVSPPPTCCSTRDRPSRARIYSPRCWSQRPMVSS
jgi:cytochrome P450